MNDETAPEPRAGSDQSSVSPQGSSAPVAAAAAAAATSASHVAELQAERLHPYMETPSWAGESQPPRRSSQEVSGKTSCPPVTPPVVDVGGASKTDATKRGANLVLPYLKCLNLKLRIDQMMLAST